MFLDLASSKGILSWNYSHSSFRIHFTFFIFRKKQLRLLGPFPWKLFSHPVPFSKEKGAWDAVEKEIKNEGIFFMRIFYVLALFRIYSLNVCPLCWLSVVTKKEKHLTYIFNRLN